MPLPTRLMTLALLGAAATSLAPADLVAQRERPRPEPRVPEPKIDDDSYEHLQYRLETFRSEALGGRQHRYTIFLPKDWDSADNKDRKWPMVLWLHGMWEDCERFADRGGGAILDKMTGDGSFGPAIFVCAEGDRSSFWTDGVGKNTAYETMVCEDLLNQLDERWPIDPDPRRRAIAGVSMGGYGALKLALKRPERFGAVAAHSAAILPEDPAVLPEIFPWVRGRGARLVEAVFDQPIDEERWRRENVLTLAKSLDRNSVGTLKIYFDCGTADRYEFDQTNAQLHDVLEDRRIAHTWRPVKDGNHGWESGYNSENLPHSLRFLNAQWAQRRAVQGLGGMLSPGGPGGGR